MKLKILILLSLLLEARISVADPLDNWSQQNSGTLANLNCVIYADGAFVVVGNNGTILRSTDGISWSNCISKTQQTLNGITYGNNIFVAVGDNITLTSTDGIIWTNQEAITNSHYCLGVAYGNETFMAAGWWANDGTQQKCYGTSPDGINWNWFSFGGLFTHFNGITFASNTFVLPGWYYANFFYGYVFYTTNGTYWTGQQASSYDITAIDYANGLEVAAGGSGSILTSIPIPYSPWTNQISGTSEWLNGIGHSSNEFVVVGNAGAILTSSDGVSWASRNTGITNNLISVTYGNGCFIAVGNNGTILKSGNVAFLPPSIITQPTGNILQVSNNVTFTVIASGTLPLNYQWQFNGKKLAGQITANLSLTNVQFANAGSYSVIVTNAYGSVTSAIAQLTVYTNLVVAQTNEPPPPPGNPTIPTDPTQFRVFTNGNFVTGIGLNPTKSTIVITHGWNDSSSGWPLEMANNIKLVLGASTPNIVAWDWTTVAAEPLPTATLDTQGQGYALGEDLATALGPNYSQRIHFIGHSLGTLVNARAANYIHANGFSWTNTQMTLFDDAEVAWGLVGNSWATLTSLLQNDSSPQQDWIYPLPDQCAWADNYITAVGMPHPLAVNVILTNLAPDLSNIQNLFDFSIGAWTGQFKTEITDYHDYPYIWYFNTVNQINNPNDPPYLMGFVRSWEGAGSAGRPSTNSYYVESLNCPPSFPSYSGYDPAYNLVQIISDQANQYLNARPQNLISQVGVNLVSSSANILANNNNQQVQLLNGPAVNVSSLITGPYNAFETAFATEVELVTTSLINGGGLVRPLGGPMPMGGSAGNSPAYIWIPVTVPSNALTMAFNFKLQGNGNQDSFQVAMNSNNLMAVETVLIPTNVTMSSGMIDVSQYAGQQAELFFGIVGGTSTNASVMVSDIAFYVTLPPSLQIQMAGTNVVLTWPLSANGYVLQSANQLTPPVSWTTVANVPGIVNLQYTVTNQISSGSRFYRLATIVAPALQTQLSGSNFILSWPMSAQNFSLQTTTNLADPNSWTTLTNVPVIVNLQITVTNSISGSQSFFRLIQSQ